MFIKTPSACARIRYLHLMAHFKMRVQIRDQSSAFIRGFKSIVCADWLDMFSTPELQKLISGDAADVDIDDLRSVFRTQHQRLCVTVIHLLSTIIKSIIKHHAQLMSWTARQHCCTYNCPLTNYKKKRIKPTRQLSI